MKRREFMMLGLVVCSLAGTVLAADNADPTGTWKWSVNFNNQQRDFTLKLKLDGDKLTGTMVGGNNQETAIEDARFNDGEVSFSVTRERNGQKTTINYKGKLDGDKIKGKSEFTRNNEPQSRDWEASREKS